MSGLLGRRQEAALTILRAYPKGVANMQWPLGKKLGLPAYMPAAETLEVMASLVQRGLVVHENGVYKLTAAGSLSVRGEA